MTVPLFVLALASNSLGLQAKTDSQDRATSPTPASASQPAPAIQLAVVERAELEKKFTDMLTKVVLRGSWQLTREEGLAGKAPLGEPRVEQYTISKVTKLGGDYWTIWARIQYADKDVNIPVPLRVLWAGDTPIITLDKVGLPGLGTYSARVMIYNGFYCGTWFGDCYGGILSGQIIKEADFPLVEAKEAETKKAASTQPAKG